MFADVLYKLMFYFTFIVTCNNYLSVCMWVQLLVDWGTAAQHAVTRWHCVETAQLIIKLSSLPGSPMILVFNDQTFSRNSNGNTLNRGVKCKG